MNARGIGLVAGLYLTACGLLPSLAWGQSGSKPSPDLDVNPIGKVLTVTGVVNIEHPAAVLVQANLPTTGNSPTKVGDLVYRGDIIETAADGALSITFADGSSFNVSKNAKMEVNEFV